MGKFWETVLVALLLALLLAAIGVAVYPCWSHSQRWGYLPSLTTGLALLLLALGAVSGHTANVDAKADRPSVPLRVAAER